MTHSIDWYIDELKRVKGLTSDNQVNKLLDKKGSTVSTWRTKRCFPDDNTIVDIARYIDIDPAQALIDLNIWRSSGKARIFYEKMTSTAASIFGALLLIATISSPEHLANKVTAFALDTVYYGKLYIIF